MSTTSAGTHTGGDEIHGKTDRNTDHDTDHDPRPGKG